MGVLARADGAELEAHWANYKQGGGYDVLRQPESGLVMVRGRAGGNGQQFNLGEITVTRCSVRLREGAIGHAYVAGRNRQHAELAAAFDALLQTPSLRDVIESLVIAPLEKKFQVAQEERSKKAAATKVNFFTMVRGEDE
ncbi:MAG TPA: phosphonate C-P lyase system protein PhnG [Rhodospirillales bacterium]|nr:phosphonate C-P lyase system protein PhnG [Rhodospirillales bacterium]